jgi:hypothetical protein
LATPLEKKIKINLQKPASMSWQSDPKPSEVDTDNIRLAFDKLLAEHRKGFEEVRKKIQEEMDQE